MTDGKGTGHGYGEAPAGDELAKKWNQRLSAARSFWEPFHKRVRHNRDTVAGFNWTADPNSSNFYRHRANLIHGTITAVLPAIYARNPEISVSPTYQAGNLKLLCKTLETVTNRSLERAKLKKRAKATVRSALTSGFGVVKVMYQRDIRRDPVIQSRIDDTQDNIVRIEGLLAQLDDPSQRSGHEAVMAELRQTMAALEEKVEIVAAEGLVIDRVLTENLLIDPTVCEFWDYEDAGWIAQVIPMKKGAAEALYKLKLDKAKSYEDTQPGKGRPREGRIASGATGLDEDRQIAIVEVWDKESQRVYTIAEGCDFWLREPYSPSRVGERWYPFFLMPFQVVDGQFVPPSLVDLTEKLQEEHNSARDRFNKHRDLCLPGYVGSADVSERTLKRFTDAQLGEVTLIDTEGKPLNQVFQPKQHPPIDPVVYDTSAVRYDWEQVTGLQDAARSSIVKPKTATEASIMQQSLSGRVSDFRDQLEDWLQEISQYAAQVLLQEMTPAQVERIMGPAKEQQIPTGGVPMVVEVPAFDWPQLTRDQVFEMVQLRIRAGSTGSPDKLEAQESWARLLPQIQQLVMQIMQVKAQGMDAEPLVNLLRETVNRFDERLDVEQFLPSGAGAGPAAGAPMTPAAMAGSPALAEGLPPPGAMPGGAMPAGLPTA